MKGHALVAAAVAAGADGDAYELHVFVSTEIVLLPNAFLTPSYPLSHPHPFSSAFLPRSLLPISLYPGSLSTFSSLSLHLLFPSDFLSLSQHAIPIHLHQFLDRQASFLFSAPSLSLFLSLSLSLSLTHTHLHN